MLHHGAGLQGLIGYIRVMQKCYAKVSSVADTLFVENWVASGVEMRFPPSELHELRKRNHNITEFPWGANLPAPVLRCQLIAT